MGTNIFSIKPSWQTDGLGVRGNSDDFWSNHSSAEQVHFIPSSVSRPVPTSPIGNHAQQFAGHGSDSSYPWIGSLIDKKDKQYYGWFGDSTYVSSSGASPLKGFKAIIQDTNDSNASQGFISVGDPDTSKDGIVFNYGGSILKFAWLDSSLVGNPEVYLQNANTSFVSLKADVLVMQDLLSGSTHAAGLHSKYLDFDSAKAFFGYRESDSDYILTLTSNNGAHGTGLHPGWLDFDNAKVGLGYIGNDYKLVIAADSNHGIGIHSSFIDIDNSNAFFGYTAGTYKVTLSDGTNGMGLTASTLSFTNSSGNGGVYVGQSRFEEADVTLKNGGGFYVDATALDSDGLHLNGNSTYLTNTYLQVTGGANVTGDIYGGSISSPVGTFDSVVSSGGLTVGASASIAGNIDAASVSTNSLTIDGTGYSSQSIKWIDPSGNIWTADALLANLQYSGTLDSCDA